MTEKKFTFDEINNFNTHLPIKLTKTDNYHKISKSLEKNDNKIFFNHKKFKPPCKDLIYCISLSNIFFK